VAPNTSSATERQQLNESSVMNMKALSIRRRALSW